MRSGGNTTGFAHLGSNGSLIQSELSLLGCYKQLASGVVVDLNALAATTIYTVPSGVNYSIPMILVAHDPALVGVPIGSILFKAGWTGGAANQFGSALNATFTGSFQLATWQSAQLGALPFSGFGAAANFAITVTNLATGLTSLTAQFDVWGLQF